MLEPQSRQLLRDALRPPPGYGLDQAILTTFSLDLIALLSVPVAFTFFPVKEGDGPPTVDPLVLLESLRRSAGQLSVFCQAGRIHLPKKAVPLFAHLEEAVVEIPARPDGIFHPKLTVLRYVSDKDARDVVYRVLCSSRNLTFDRSWDTMLTLDGQLRPGRMNAFSRNKPLSRFVAALPGLANGKAPAASVDRAKLIAEELLKVDFELPDDFDELQFLPLGIDEATTDWPILGHDKLLVMAPFVDGGFLAGLKDSAVELISRPESLDELSAQTLAGLEKAWYLNAAAEPARDDSTAETEPEVGIELAPAEQLSGLHAKLFVADDGPNAHVFTGSANATTAAFERNVEFLIRLRGKKKDVGIEALLGRAVKDGNGGNDKSAKFADLLVPYHRDGAAIVDEDARAIERLLDTARYALGGAAMTATVEPVGEAFRVHLTTETAVEMPDEVSVLCHPLTLKPNNAIEVANPVGSTVAVFDPLTFEAITSFYGFTVTAKGAKSEKSCSFVVNAKLVGAPADRAGRLLALLLHNREQLMRYLLFLLASDEAEAWQLAEALAMTDGSTAMPAGEFGLPLLEPLLASLDRRPGQLDSFSRLIEDLCKTPSGRDLIGEKFLAVWQAVWAARLEIKRD